MNLLDAGDPSASAREELLNKWKDKSPEEVLKAKIEADIHIKTLEREKAELYGEYTKQHEELLAKAKLEELIDRLEKSPRETQVAITPANEVKEPKYDPVEMEKLILSKIQETEHKKVEVANYNKVEAKLKERYGENFSPVLKDQQNTLGLSDADVNNLAMKSPEAFFRVMGLNTEPKDGYVPPPRNIQRNDSFAPRTQKRDYNYYQELKKTNPKIYLDPKISAQMERDAIALGDAFGLPS